MNIFAFTLYLFIISIHLHLLLKFTKNVEKATEMSYNKNGFRNYPVAKW